ncbi:MAG: hypothetical protein PHY47_25245 [Lachnospiraceae bacterium]|nr:hypothetical protein [Lachnospiraceae bacterium]
MRPVKIVVQVNPETEEISVCTGDEFKEELQKNNQKIESAIYIDRNRMVWGLSEDLAMGILDSYGNNSKSEMIGKSDYILIFDSKNEIGVGENRYIAGDCLIMKSENGLKCISDDEIEDAMKQYGSRLTIIKMGQFSISGYQLN